MADLTQWISADELPLIKLEERQWLAQVFERFGGYPDLEQMWGLMDEAWVSLGCDAEVMDASVDAFYRHPVWLLNGLFIEQHNQSREYREQFKDWVAKHSPNRVAEFGGGFGTLARNDWTSTPRCVD